MVKNLFVHLQEIGHSAMSVKSAATRILLLEAVKKDNILAIYLLSSVT